MGNPHGSSLSATENNISATFGVCYQNRFFLQLYFSKRLLIGILALRNCTRKHSLIFFKSLALSSTSDALLRLKFVRTNQELYCVQLMMIVLQPMRPAKRRWGALGVTSRFTTLMLITEPYWRTWPSVALRVCCLLYTHVHVVCLFPLLRPWFLSWY